MDINMKNIELGRLEVTQWITIDEKNEKGVVIRQTKLLYADENYTDNEISLLEKQMRDQNTYNAWDIEADIAGTADYMM